MKNEYIHFVREAIDNLVEVVDESDRRTENLLEAKDKVIKAQQEYIQKQKELISRLEQERIDLISILHEGQRNLKEVYEREYAIWRKHHQCVPATLLCMRDNEERQEILQRMQGLSDL